MKKKSVSIPIELVELENENYHLLINSKLENGEEAFWVVDSGASKSVFDITKESFFEFDENTELEVKSAGIGEGSVETAVGIIRAIYFEGFCLENWKVALIDLSHINRLYKQFTDHKICGLLGSDFLIKYKAILNFETLELILKT